MFNPIKQQVLLIVVRHGEYIQVETNQQKVRREVIKKKGYPRLKKWLKPMASKVALIISIVQEVRLPFCPTLLHR